MPNFQFLNLNMFTRFSPITYTLCLALAILASACNQTPETNIDKLPVVSESSVEATPTETTTPPEPVSPVIDLSADAAAIVARPEVPILCYHQIRDWTASDSEQAKTYIVPVRNFEEQIKLLADSGYHSISPDELLAYLTTGAKLPPKAIMLTFDDTNLSQYEVAAPVLEKYGFKGVFFVMTVSLGRPRYMSKQQVRELAEKGHTIGSHTWDHHNVKKYAVNDWLTQVEKPKQVLEEIVGHPITYFAYPFGLWNSEAIPELKNRGTTASFQLAAAQDTLEPLHSIRRIIASGYWNATTLQKKMEGSFNRRHKD
ncbi:polysaccharide deacetylase family protein [Pontibacter rugosus]|uniref:Polysaccharide deacetylase family protein n=1 Tax=Pontibacter rugosus TaxID=1745966 RepID=A0ABW3SUA5_9BACT